MQQVKLAEKMVLEIQGLPVHCEPGDVVEVGRQQAERWIETGQAVRVEDPLPVRPEPKVNVAGRYTANAYRAR